MAVKTPIIAIVGRPNVGKSTFFNRVLGEKRAVVEDVPGVTRDRNYALVRRFSIPFHLVDTGGFEDVSSDELQNMVSDQARLATEEADLVVCLFDAQTGVHPGDEDVVRMLRAFDKPVRFAANKCDGQEQQALSSDFYSFGIDELHDFSALHGRGVGAFIEESLKSLPNYTSLLASHKSQLEREEARALESRDELERAGFLSDTEEQDYEEISAADEGAGEGFEEDAEEQAPPPQFAPVFMPSETEDSVDDYRRQYGTVPLTEGNRLIKPEADEIQETEERAVQIDCIRVALVGRPNVGKSTLLNTLVGERRAITSPIAGTTRDSVDLKIRRDGQDFLIIDTAGLRKKARIGDQIERYSVLRSLAALNECDVAVVLIDAERGPSEQDAKIVGLAHEHGRGIVLVVNKWDLVEKSHRSAEEFRTKMRETFKFSPYAPLLFISAETGKRCPKVIESVREVAYARARRVTTYRLNRVLERAVKKVSPPVHRGRRVKLYYAAQVADSPPRIALFFNYPRAVHFSYLRYLKNELREAFGFEGTDIKLMARKRS